MTTSQKTIRDLFKVASDNIGNLPSLPAIFPDSIAPVVRKQGDERELLMMRWGFPSPTLGTHPVTNVRNAKSGYWHEWFKPEFRCLVPATSFCEWTDRTPNVTYWFALNDERPLFAFAGIWRPWTGTRGPKANPIEGEHLLYSFLTTEPNSIVRPVHAKAMPVILREDEWSTWLEAPIEHALRLQTPLPDSELIIVARGEREDK